MATTTSNIGLTKPAGTDFALVSVINTNSDILDSAAGGLMDALAIVAQGNTHAAISAGQYVYVRGHDTLAEGLYVAASAIAANATLTSSNLTADTAGGLNSLNSKIDPFSADAITDCNTAIKTGRYKTINSTANTPFTGHFVLDVIEYNTTEISQVARLSYSTRVFVRGSADGGATWSSWQELALKSDIGQWQIVDREGDVSVPIGTVAAGATVTGTKSISRADAGVYLHCLPMYTMSGGIVTSYWFDNYQPTSVTLNVSVRNFGSSSISNEASHVCILKMRNI